jgi:PAS domain S-box-containing protein
LSRSSAVDGLPMVEIGASRVCEIEAQLFRSFSDAMPYGVCLVDTQCKIIYWNAAAEEITGYLAHEVLGRAYRGDLLIHCEGSTCGPEVQCPVMEVLRDGRPVAAGLFLRHKLGHRRPIHVLAFPLRDAMGEMKGAGEILDPSHGSRESPAWSGRSDREFEIATGLPTPAESWQHLRIMLHTEPASSSVLILIEMSEQRAILQHGGTAMLHQALRTLARTIAGLLPAHHFLGCWSDWRLIAIVPGCEAELIESLKSTLAGVGSSCAVKWWGDRLLVGTRAVARPIDPSQTIEALIQGLEQDLKSIADREE